MIALNNVCFRYPDTELHFDLTIPAGQCVALLGPRGAGKSTLLDLIGGFLRPEQGEIVLDGKASTELPPSQRPVTSLFQSHNLFEHLSVYQNIALGLSPSARLNRQQDAQLQAAAQEVGLADLLQRQPGQLSGGQRQRVALARCLLRHQPILLLDEPFSALDPALRRDMLQRLKQLAKSRRLTVVMITHSPEDARWLSERALFLDQGKILADEATEVLLTQTQQPRVQHWLGTA